MQNEENMTLEEVAQVRWKAAVDEMCRNIITTMINPRRKTNKVFVQLIGTALIVCEDIPGVTTKFSKFKMATHAEAKFVFTQLKQHHSDCGWVSANEPDVLRIRQYLPEEIPAA